MRNTQVLFKARPEGWVDESHFEIVESESRAPKEGEALVRNLYLSVDPYMRGRMRDTKSYVPGFELGKPLQGGGVGQVVESRSPTLPVGAYVSGMVGWENYTTAPAEAFIQADSKLAPLSAYLGALGMPSMTAWYGMKEIGKAQPGETVVISAASGAVGQIAGQMAKMIGCRVVGTVGSEQKLRYIVDELGFDAGINYKTAESLTGALEEACPEGIDVYFENVGGVHLEAALASARANGRFALCGMISQYNATGRPVGPPNLMLAVGKCLRLQGFIVSHHAHRREAFLRDVAGWIASGQLTWKETVLDGIERAPEAFLRLFSGGNLGKMLVKLG